MKENEAQQEKCERTNTLVDSNPLSTPKNPEETSDADQENWKYTGPDNFINDADE
jgi:hypothetical protein